eukprot:jgi/Botrbrau1/16851/Bobra.150_2s0073.1
MVPRGPLAYCWEPLNEPAVPESRPVLKRTGHAAVAVDGHFIYIIGGRTSSRTHLSDIMRYDINKAAWDMSLPTGSFTGRYHHSATVIGRHIWVVGGTNGKLLLQDVQAFDLDTLEWRQVNFKGNQELLGRVGHGVVVHPCRPQALLIFGGVCENQNGHQSWSDQLIILDTARRTVEEVHVRGAKLACGRAYHTFTALGSRCVVIGGRMPCTDVGTKFNVVSGPQYVAIYDAEGNCWMKVESTGGVPPPPRSSHRAVVVGDRIVVHGGALCSGERTACMASLQLHEGGCCSWSDWDNDLCSASHPPGRAAHAVAVLGTRLFIFAGYQGPHVVGQGPDSGQKGSIGGDAWSVTLAKTCGEAERHWLAFLQSQQRQEAVRRPRVSAWRQSGRIRSASQLEGSQSPREQADAGTAGAGATLANARRAALTCAHTLPAELGWARPHCGWSEPSNSDQPGPPPAFHASADNGNLAKVRRTANTVSDLAASLAGRGERCLNGGPPPHPAPANAPGSTTVVVPASPPLHEAQLAALQAQLQRVVEELREARDNAGVEHCQAQEAAAKLRSAEASLQLAEGRAGVLASEAEGLRQELQKQRELNAQLTSNHKKDIDLLGQGQLDLQKALSEAAGAKREALDAIEEGRRTATQLGREIDNLRKTLEKQQDAYSSVSSLVQAKERELGEERTAVAELKRELAEERARRSREGSQAATAMKEAQSQLAAVHARCVAAEGQARQHALDLDEARTKLKAAEDRLARLEPELKQKSVELSDLRASSISWEAYKTGAQASVKQLTQHLEAFQRLVPTLLPPS